MKNELEIFLEQFDKLTLDSRQISKNTVFIAYKKIINYWNYGDKW